MGQIIKCDEGHFYDKAQNATCPFCGVGHVDWTHKANKIVADDDVDPTIKYEPDRDTTVMYGGPGASGKPGKGKRAQSAGDPEKTVAVWLRGSGIDPVVGWLVCHEGANQGRDYRIRSGYNTIGRDTSSQICIAGDDTIARIDHARLFYDLKNATFFVIAGSGRSGVYVNNQVVLQSTALKAYDVLEIGVTKLVFVPFCGDRFRWDTSQVDGIKPAIDESSRSPSRGRNEGTAG
ncbi:FHA domain-containing protein [Variovorax saccharolyticus]|uniref:FHA domain-containing protein n=1 Tax=Variovorax saccharolyticus TaxID=3053516 RepID=UPI002577BF6A|nr:FHA domain-containing protein [Variovorax sp. J31P216]MDM0029587.1 FHA domain-containing protein [Variovorax sp. J31P216]